MKDREISRLVFLNIALGLACVLSGIFFLWLHKSVGAAPGGTTEAASDSLVANAVTTRSPEATSSVPEPTSTETLSILPAPASFQSFSYQNGMSLTVSGKCLAPYFVILIFPATVDYRDYPRGFVFNSAYPCTRGSDFSKTISQSDLRLSTGVSYYIVKADEKDSGTWYNPR